MAGLVPAIHVFLAARLSRRGCPAQWHLLGPAKPDPSAGHDENENRAVAVRKLRLLYGGLILPF
jgi:hypothetical protein